MKIKPTKSRIISISRGKLRISLPWVLCPARPRDLSTQLVVPLTSPGAGVHSSSLTPPLHLSQEKSRAGATNLNLRLHPSLSRLQAANGTAHPICAGCRDLHGQARGSARRPDLLPPGSSRQGGHILCPQAVYTAQLGPPRWSWRPVLTI